MARKYTNFREQSNSHNNFTAGVLYHELSRKLGAIVKGANITFSPTTLKVAEKRNLIAFQNNTVLYAFARKGVSNVVRQDNQIHPGKSFKCTAWKGG